MKKKGVIIMRNRMKQTRLMKQFRLKAIFHNVIAEIVNEGLTSSDQFTISKYSQVDKCLSDQIYIHIDTSVNIVFMQNFRLLFAISVIMLPASIIVLLIELYSKQ